MVAEDGHPYQCAWDVMIAEPIPYRLPRCEEIIAIC